MMSELGGTWRIMLPRLFRRDESKKAHGGTKFKDVPTDLEPLTTLFPGNVNPLLSPMVYVCFLSTLGWLHSAEEPAK